MNKLLLTFYGDDFTGSTDALEQLTLAGIRTALFIAPPTPAQLEKFPGLQAIGVAGKTRSLAPDAMERELKPALLALKKLGARHVHYKVCSTFDSSPTIGSIGRVMDVAAKIFPAQFIPLLVATPALGRYTIFGNHFARYGIGSAGAIHRLDQHPSISKHPVTPMLEADLRKHLARIGGLTDEFASAKRPLFSVGSSGIETALAAHRAGGGVLPRVLADRQVSPTEQILIGSGSCSPVTGGQIVWALKHGFAEVALDAAALVGGKNSAKEIKRATDVAAAWLNAGRSVIVHSTRSGLDKHIAAKLTGDTAKILGTALGKVLRGARAQSKVRRVCIAGGDTSSFAARALGIEALEMIASLTPGAPLCRAFAPSSPADGLEVVFKGGQVGAENYFGIVKNGKT